MIGDPNAAAPRTDLVFLRRRSRPRPPASPQQAPARSSSQPAPVSGGIDYTRHRPAAPAPPTRAPTRAATAAGPTGSTIDFSRPARHPSTPPAAAAQPGSSGGALDLSDPAPAATPRRPSKPPLRVHQDARVGGHGQHLLGPDSPTVTLTRVQSGVGHLTIEAMCSAAVGDLRLGALYQLRSGGTSTVQHAGGNRFAPSSRRPVVVAGREEYERLGIDLRQVGDIERIGVYAFSESRTTLTWGGTLVLTLFGGARVELPLESLSAGTVAVLLSIYNLDGELVLLTEMETIDGDIRAAARAYGYDRIAWRDDRTPVD